MKVRAAGDAGLSPGLAAVGLPHIARHVIAKY
jgi:hypothetical protein